MAMQLGNRQALNSDMNVTPLVDVVLVLLIIFMVVTPLIKQEVPLELPVADNSQEAKDLVQMTLTVDVEGLLLLNGQNVLPEALVPHLQAIYATRADKTIFLEADRYLPYGRIVDVMDDCRAAGVTTIGVLTKREKEKIS